MASGEFWAWVGDETIGKRQKTIGKRRKSAKMFIAKNLFSFLKNKKSIRSKKYPIAML
jgi:hypothetical protein